MSYIKIHYHIIIFLNRTDLKRCIRPFKEICIILIFLFRVEGWARLVSSCTSIPKGTFGDDKVFESWMQEWTFAVVHQKEKCWLSINRNWILFIQKQMLFIQSVICITVFILCIHYYLPGWPRVLKMSKAAKNLKSDGQTQHILLFLLLVSVQYW